MYVGKYGYQCTRVSWYAFMLVLGSLSTHIFVLVFTCVRLFVLLCVFACYLLTLKIHEPNCNIDHVLFVVIKLYYSLYYCVFFVAIKLYYTLYYCVLFVVIKLCSVYDTYCEGYCSMFITRL